MYWWCFSQHGLGTVLHELRESQLHLLAVKHFLREMSVFPQAAERKVAAFDFLRTEDSQYQIHLHTCTCSFFTSIHAW